MKPVNLFYASAGNGHKYAALALKECLDARGPGSIVMDVLAFGKDLFRWSCSTGYDVIGRRCHPACKLMYWLTDRDRRSTRALRLIDEMSERGLRLFSNHVKENQPEIAICTHFFPATILAGMKRRGTYRGRIYTVVTDYGLHKMWLNEGCDRYFVSGEPVRDSLRDLDVPARRIAVTGIPVRSRFASMKLPKHALAVELNLDPNKFTVLVIASALPGRFVRRLLDALFRSALNLNLLLVGGNNQGARDKSDRFTSTDLVTLRRYDFVERIDKLMGFADVILTKPGGLCITEALVTGTPMILTHPIPDQEVHNAEFMVQIGAGIAAESINAIVQAIERLQGSPSVLLEMRRQATRHATPQAAQTIVEQILQDVYSVAAPMQTQPFRSDPITAGMAQ